MSKTLRIQVRRRRFAFRFGLSFVAVEERPKKRGGGGVLRGGAEG